MGCGATKESIESDMMTLKLYRIEIKDQKKKMMDRFEKLTGKRVKRIKVPDYIDHEAMKICRSKRSIEKKKNSVKKGGKSLRGLNEDMKGANGSIGDISDIETVLQTVN